MPDPARSIDRAARYAVASVMGAAALAGASAYPLAPGLAVAGLFVYGWALWRWPVLWLAVVPAALPALDLAPWSGWIWVEESDLVVVATIAVLVLRAPPRRADFVFVGLARAAITLTIVAALVGVALGLLRPGPPGGTVIAELSRWNALRIAKGLAIALALLPFLRQAIRERADAMVWLAAGMAAGLALVAAATIVEREAFTGLRDFTTPYRVVATFSSMHFGGGYIGAYAAMALPFLFVLVAQRGLVLRVGAAGIALGAFYTIVVTFARAAYGSALLSSMTVVLLSAFAPRRAIAAPVTLLLAIGAIGTIASLDARFMVRRIEFMVPDFETRLDQWQQGLAIADRGLATRLFGMGLGSYARTVLAVRPAGRAPTNIAMANADGRTYLVVRAGTTIYIGQKVAVEHERLYHVTLTARAPDRGAPIGVVLCEKLLLYSGNCQSTDFLLEPGAGWTRFSAFIASDGIGERIKLGFLRRPVELSVFAPMRGSTVEIADVSLEDAAGHELVANGDFSAGLDHWFLTDDDHAIWRIENEYLTIFFEEGALGLAALLLLTCAALVASFRATRRGDAVAPALAAATVAALASGFFDCPLEVPRLGALFYLLAFAAFAVDAASRRDKGPAVAGQALELVEPRGIEPRTSTMPL